MGCGVACCWEGGKIWRWSGRRSQSRARGDGENLNDFRTQRRKWLKLKRRCEVLPFFVFGFLDLPSYSRAPCVEMSLTQLYHSFLWSVVVGRKKKVLWMVVLRFFEAWANCSCLLHFSHQWLSAFVWTRRWVWVACAVERWTCVHWQIIIVPFFVCLSSCYFLLSQVFTPTHNTTNTGGNKKECTILIFFFIFTLTCYLEHSVRNHLRLFWECGCEFLVYIGYFTCAVIIIICLTMSKSVDMCCSFCGWFKFILFSFLRIEPTVCYTESSQEGKKIQRSAEKETRWNR